MGADLGTFFDQADVGIGVKLLETYRRSQPRRASANDHYIKFHYFTHFQSPGPNGIKKVTSGNSQPDDISFLDIFQTFVLIVLR
jgi:hypothetical protein